MDMNQNLIILSAELESATHSGNRQRTETLKGMLEDLNLEFAEAIGYWKGTEEDSFVVRVNDQAEYETVMNFAFKNFHQDAILHQEDGEAYVVSNGLYEIECDYAGKLVEVNPKEVEQLENFTIVNNRVYTTK
jgi:hypothetical protein